SPMLAQDIANTFLDAFDQTHREYFSSSKELEWLTEQTEKLAKSAEAAEKALATFREQTGIYDLTTQRTELSNRISDLDKQIIENQGEMHAIDEAIATHQAALAKENEYDSPDATASRVPNPDRTALLDARARKVEELDKLKTQFKEDSSFFRSKAPPIQNEIAQIDDKLSKTPA